MSNLIQRLGQTVKNALAVYWDDVLTPSDENPFPLASKSAAKAGVVNSVSYKRQNRRMMFRSMKVMVPQILRMKEEPGFGEDPKKIVILGAGLLRDLKWLINASILGFPVIICDASTVACDKAHEFAEEHGLGEIEIIKADIESAWNQGDINEEEVLAYYGGQFIQNLDEEARDRVLEHLGRFLGIPTSGGRLRRRVYLLHARGEDNPPEVEWRNSIPYKDAELRAPLEKGFGGPVTMEKIGRHRHWDQVYTFFEIKGV